MGRTLMCVPRHRSCRRYWEFCFEFVDSLLAYEVLVELLGLRDCAPQRRPSQPMPSSSIVLSYDGAVVPVDSAEPPCMVYRHTLLFCLCGYAGAVNSKSKRRPSLVRVTNAERPPILTCISCEILTVQLQ